MIKEPRIYIGEKIVSSIKSARKTEQPYAEEWNWTTILHHTQTSTQNGLMTWRPETVKLLQENIGSKLLGIGVGNDFLDMSP